MPLLRQKQCRKNCGETLLASKQWHTVSAVTDFPLILTLPRGNEKKDKFSSNTEGPSLTDGANHSNPVSWKNLAPHPDLFFFRLRVILAKEADALQGRENLFQSLFSKIRDP